MRRSITGNYYLLEVGSGTLVAAAILISLTAIVSFIATEAFQEREGLLRGSLKGSVTKGGTLLRDVTRREFARGRAFHVLPGRLL